MSEGRMEGVSKGGGRDVLLQLLREMGIPFVIAAGWTIYSLVVTPAKRTLVDAITVFGGSFFLVCWAFAQWFRVKKQQAVESGLGGIIKKQEALVAALTAATDRLAGHASGGKSVGWLLMTHPRDGVIRDITAHVEGDYPLLDARASVIDLDKGGAGLEEFKRTGDIQDFFKHHVKFNCGMLQPTLAIIQREVVPCDTTKPLMRFRVDWTARNGTWSQFVQLKRNGQKYEFYTAIQRDGEWVYENPTRDTIPKRPDGSPDVFWHAEVTKEPCVAA